MKTLITSLVLLLFAGTANAQYGYNSRSQVPYPFGYNAPFQNYGSTNYPFGYRSPYQGGFNGYGSYYGGRNSQLNNLPMYGYPSYQPYLNPYYQPRPYFPYPY